MGIVTLQLCRDEFNKMEIIKVVIVWRYRYNKMEIINVIIMLRLIDIIK